jgi:hypothetical protein
MKMSAGTSGTMTVSTQENFDMSRDLIHQHMKDLAGRVLTVVEASYSNPSQLNAVKTLIKKEFSEQMNRVNCYCVPDGLCETEV